MITIRDAKAEDAKRLLEIYAYYILNTAITFEYAVPTVDEFKSRIEKTIKAHPYIVIEDDGDIKGYAYASKFQEREAYKYSNEISIYLDIHAQKKGYGRKLYEELEARLKDLGITNLYACIAYTSIDDEYLNNNSANFHEHMGYKTVGHFHNCGYKFNKWYDMIWMEKIINKHKSQ